MKRLAIIGAGVAGLAAARRLQRLRPDITSTLYEQTAVAGGRVATSRRDGFVFDHGAQYVKADSPEIERLIRDELPDAGLRDIAKPVWTFDGAGGIAEGDPAQNADPKWTYAAGLDRLGALLAEGLDIRYQTSITQIAQTPNGWQLENGASADFLLLTQPAPHAATLLENSDVPQKERVLDLLRSATYRSCISVALAYNQPIVRPFYALVNTDRAHPISWLALEHDKGPERCPPGHSLLLVQMGARWSTAEWQTPEAAIGATVAELAARLLGENLRAPLWHDVRRWDAALPHAGAEFAALNDAVPGLFFAGDYTAGQGRVHLAIESGWRAAETIAGTIG